MKGVQQTLIRQVQRLWQSLLIVGKKPQRPRDRREAFCLPLGPLGPAPSESMDRSGASHNFTAMREPFRNEVFFSRSDGYASAVNDQGITTLDHDHVFVVFMQVRR